MNREEKETKLSVSSPLKSLKLKRVTSWPAHSRVFVLLTHSLKLSSLATAVPAGADLGGGGGGGMGGGCIPA